MNVLVGNQGHDQKAECPLCFGCLVTDKVWCFGKLIDYHNLLGGGKPFIRMD